MRPPPSGTAPALRLTGVARSHGRGRRAVHALRGVDLELPAGTFTAVMGRSGSGKTTLLQCAAGLDRPSAGSVRLGGTDLTRMRERPLTRLRRSRIGFVFQSFNLLPALTVEQNVLLPLRLDGRGRNRRPDRARAAALLELVGLADRARELPGRLSGGQRQRVAIARALVTDPELVCADEPTGSLDPETAEVVLDALRSAVDRLGATVLMVTHDPAAAAWTDRIVLLADGLRVDGFAPPPGRGPDAAAAIARRVRAGGRGPHGHPAPDGDPYLASAPAAGLAPAREAVR